MVLGQQSSGDLDRHLPVHNPEGEPQTIPAKVAQAAKGFQRAMRANIVREEFRGLVKGKSRSDTLDLAKVLTIVKHLAQYG